MTSIKICGVRSVADAEMCVDAGADAIGVNFWPGTRRYCEPPVGAAIARAVGAAAQVVAVFVDADRDAIRRTLTETGIAWAQLHGDEPPELVQALLPHAYKALRVGGPGILTEARRYPGEHLLLDACVPGEKGGTGHTFDWTLAAELARERTLTLAGGLVPHNVAAAIQAVRPYRVDVASGVESSPGCKDRERVRAFVQAVRSAG